MEISSDEANLFIALIEGALNNGMVKGVDAVRKCLEIKDRLDKKLSEEQKK